MTSSQPSVRAYSDILAKEVARGQSELERPAGGLLVSGLSAGLDLGFSVFLMAIILTLTEGALPRAVVAILVANMYSVGFLFVVLGRSELFTEHTAVAVFPVLAGRAGLRSLGRLWVLVYVSNVAGAVLFAVLVVTVGPALDVIRPAAFGEIAIPLLRHAWWAVLFSAMLAGWLMGLLSWLVTASGETIGKVFFVWLVTTSIGLGHLHHCIVGTTEVLSGLLAGAGVTVWQFGRFLVLTTIGNAVGGVVFVALIKYRHVIQPGSAPESVDPHDG